MSDDLRDKIAATQRRVLARRALISDVDLPDYLAQAIIEDLGLTMEERNAGETRVSDEGVVYYVIESRGTNREGDRTVNWDKKAADAAIEYAKPTMRPVQTLSDHMADAFHAGARWQREALLSDETEDRVADVLVALDGDDYLMVARAALTAAIEGDE